MKISDLIAFVGSVKPNAFPCDAKVSWLNEVEGMVWCDVMLLSPLEFKPYSYDEVTGEGDCELLVYPPHNKLYNVYLSAMIDFYNGEYDKYQNGITLFNSHYGEYMRWYAMHYRPADGEFKYMGEYITAYGIAVKHGFKGTEEEWLLSLKGEVDEEMARGFIEDYLEKNPIPAPVQSVNGKTGTVQLAAEDVGARADSWMPTASEVGARPSTWMPSVSEVGADPAGTAEEKVISHNVDGAAHNDLRILLVELKTKVENFLDIDDVTADELSEVIGLIRDNADLIEGITKSKVNVSDIINNLTTNVSNKPLSAAQGVAIKTLIDELEESIADAESLAKKAVRTVNGKSPDENGNVEIEEGGGGIANETDPTIYVGSGDAPEGTKVQIDPEGETMEILTPDDVNEVLEEAKASGMFDGAPGIDGADGVGIASAEMNSDYSLTLTFTDGTSYTTPSIRGANGEDGTNGLGFSGAYLDENGQLILVYEDDNGEIAVGTVVGENGTNGTNGKSVHYASSSSKQNPDGYYEFAISALIAQRDDLIIADDSYVYQIHSFDTNEIALCNRLFSIKGTDGKNGSNGTNGADGTSVTVSKVTESTASGGTNVVTFSDGTTLNVKNGKDGADGAKGDKGDTGATGPQGPAYTLTDSDRDTIASAVKASLPTLTLTGKDADGVSHTWTVYGT